MQKGRPEAAFSSLKGAARLAAARIAAIAVAIVVVAAARTGRVGDDTARSGANQTAGNSAADRIRGKTADQGTRAAADQRATGDAVLASRFTTAERKAHTSHNQQLLEHVHFSRDDELTRESIQAAMCYGPSR
jgi:hypothetical protein